MRLVITMGIRQLPSQPRPLHDLYREYLEEAVLAEKLGFDNVWASEHHFSDDAWNPSPITFLAAVAARTERVRIGTYAPGAVWAANMTPVTMELSNLTTSDALTRSATELSKFATRCTFPSSRVPRTTAAGASFCLK